MNRLRKSLVLGMIAGVLLLGGGAVGIAESAEIEIEYSLLNVARSRLNYPLQQVDKAVLHILKNMGVLVNKENEVIDGREILADTETIEITIQLKKLKMKRSKSKITKISVDARIKKFIVEKDKAMAADIINRTQETLETRTWGVEKPDME